MVGIVFWNAAKRPLAEEVAELCVAKDCDIIILAECIYSGTEIVDAINKKALVSPFSEFQAAPSILRFYTRLPASTIEATLDAGRVSIRHVLPIVGAPLLIVSAHLRSKLQADVSDQRLLASGVMALIKIAEQQVGHTNTIVIGDFNMHPFDEGMISADCFHAVSDKRTALRLSRSVGNVEYEFFYNPFWSRLGDESAGPPGTFYKNKGGAINHYWSQFDQVLLRPALFPYYKSDELEVVTAINGKPLLKGDGLDMGFSDHLPIAVRLSTENAVS